MIFRHSVFLDLAGLSSSLRFPLLEFGAGGGGGGGGKDVCAIPIFRIWGVFRPSTIPPFHPSIILAFRVAAVCTKHARKWTQRHSQRPEVI